MTPTVGRIVHYRPAREDRLAVGGCNNASVLPAVIVSVHSNDLVNLKVLNDGHEDFWVTSVSPGSDEGQWSWPERVA